MAKASRISMKQSNTFPFRLHEMLDTVEREGAEDVVSWIPGHDSAFKVHKPKQFVETIMPRFFQQTKYKSFQRQCNLWGFERLLHGPEKGGYEHQNGFFVRGNPALVSKMERRKVKRRPAGASAVQGVDGMIVNNNNNNNNNTITILDDDDDDVVLVMGEEVTRRPSIVSCSSNSINSNNITNNIHASPTSMTSKRPSSPLVAAIESVEEMLNLPTDLYLPPPPSQQHQQPAQAPRQAEAVATQAYDEIADENDEELLEGLSVFLEDRESTGTGVAMATTAPTMYPAPSSTSALATGATVMMPPPLLPRPKRRFSVELFTGTRQPPLSQDEELLDLLTGTDELQESLERELMCRVV